MGSTYNRRPVSFNVPDTSEVGIRTYNQLNWKGIIDSDNIFAVDQESFSDCENVYVDRFNVLSSRPNCNLLMTTVGYKYYETATYFICYNTSEKRLIIYRTYCYV